MKLLPGATRRSPPARSRTPRAGLPPKPDRRSAFPDNLHQCWHGPDLPRPKHREAKNVERPSFAFVLQKQMTAVRRSSLRDALAWVNLVRASIGEDYPEKQI